MWTWKWFLWPVDEWSNVGGVNLLEKLYTDPSKWGMTFQSYVTLTMLKGHLQSIGQPIKVMERSLFSSRYCFVELMLANRVLEPGMYQALQEWYDFIDEYHQIKVDLIVYLRTSPMVAFQQMQARARMEETAVPLAYLEHLHQLAWGRHI